VEFHVLGFVMINSLSVVNCNSCAWIFVWFVGLFDHRFLIRNRNNIEVEDNWYSFIWWQIKKFRDALAKHTPDRCSLEPTKGLEEKELIALSENKDLNFTYTPKPSQPVHTPANEEVVTEAVPSLTSKSEVSKERPLVTAWRWCGQFVGNHILWLHPLYSVGWV